MKETRIALTDLDRLVVREADRIAVALRDTLPSVLVGVYLHGSAALGDWIPRRSDLDILAVSSRGLSDPEVQSLVTSLLAPPSPPDAPALEFSLVTLDAVRAQLPAPPFELHLTNGIAAKVVDGRAHPGDPDLVLHFEVCRTRGLALVGPPPDEVFESSGRVGTSRCSKIELVERFGAAHNDAPTSRVDLSRAPGLLPRRSRRRMR